PAGQGQVVDAHRRAGADLEDPAGVVAADGQAVSAGAVDAQVVCDQQLPARQGDGAITGRRGEPDQVGAGAGVGVEGRLSQGCGAAVGEVADREGAGDGPVLQPFDAQPGRQAPLPEPCGTVSILRAGRRDEGTCGS